MADGPPSNPASVPPAYPTALLTADAMNVDSGATAAANETATTAAANETAATAAATAMPMAPATVADAVPALQHPIGSASQPLTMAMALSQRPASTNGRPRLSPQGLPYVESQSRDDTSLPATVDHIPSFDWDEFEERYERALADMNNEEKELLGEFAQLVNYFNVWAAASSAHDDERAVKRLQTRERYVRIAEQSLGQRKQHLAEVVRAFQSALALLSQT